MCCAYWTKITFLVIKLQILFSISPKYHYLLRLFFVWTILILHSHNKTKVLQIFMNIPSVLFIKTNFTLKLHISLFQSPKNTLPPKEVSLRFFILLTKKVFFQDFQRNNYFVITNLYILSSIFTFSFRPYHHKTPVRIQNCMDSLDSLL